VKVKVEESLKFREEGMMDEVGFDELRESRVDWENETEVE